MGGERGNAAAAAAAAALAVILLSAACIVSVSGYMIYRVGDDEGWTDGAPGGVDYPKWASQKTFQVGDMLVFAYTTANHTVFQTSSQDAFDACDSGATDAKIWSADGSSSANVLLTTPGKTYFLCGADAGSHCRGGMKFGIDVAGAAPAAGSDGLVAPTGSPVEQNPWNSPAPFTEITPPFLTPDQSAGGGAGAISSPGIPGSITTPSSTAQNSNSAYYSRASGRNVVHGFGVVLLAAAGTVFLL